jgi:hypothetical protein
MLKTAKSYARNLLKDTLVWDSIQRVRDGRLAKSWERRGKPSPPPHVVKRRILSSYAAMYGTRTLVETGTYLGDMIYAMRDKFREIYSIELSNDLAKKARRRFQVYGYIQILAGDSGELLPQILGNLCAPCLFWLDGHYSGGITARGQGNSPIMEEVAAILGHTIKTHVLLIDDARCFDGTDGYPTMSELRELFQKAGPEYEVSVADDVIRIYPRCATTRES